MAYSENCGNGGDGIIRGEASVESEEMVPNRKPLEVTEETAQSGRHHPVREPEKRRSIFLCANELRPSPCTGWL